MLEQLIKKLSHIDQSKWVLKNINDIMEEIMCNETQLLVKDGVLTRCLTIGFCNIYHGDKKLMELSQSWPNGTVVERNQPVAGKLRYTEDPTQEMLREIHEELGIPLERINITSVKVEYQIGDSPYYPGLPSYWLEHFFELVLPDDLYKEQYIEDDGKKITIFGWVPK